MESESLKINQEEQKTDSSLVPRIRPAVYTASELCRSVIVWTRPIMDVLTWQLPIVTSSWLILGLVGIYLLTSISLPSLLGLVGLVVMGMVMLYAAVKRVDPYQELEHHPWLAVRVSPEAVDLVADRVTDWANRWLATGQYLIFGRDYRPSLLVSIIAFYLAMMCAFFGSSTVIMMAYCFAFIVPKMWLCWVCDWRQLRQLPWPPNMLFKRQNILQLNEMQEQVPLQEEENTPEGDENKENQEPEVSGI